MPVTMLVLLILSVLTAAGLTVVAVAAWGVTKVLPLVVVFALMARWAMQSVPGDDTHA